MARIVSISSRLATYFLHDSVAVWCETAAASVFAYTQCDCHAIPFSLRYSFEDDMIPPTPIASADAERGFRIEGLTPWS